MSLDLENLYEKARSASRHAYAPYSGFRVGAALLAEGGDVFSGCNVENASYGVGTCAERVACASALAAGQRSFQALAIHVEGADGAPCGACRQFLSEFAPDLTVVYRSGNALRTTTLRTLLPDQFNAAALPPAGTSTDSQQADA